MATKRGKENANKQLNDKIEVKLTHRGTSLNLYLEEKDDVKKLREMIKNTFSYAKINQFEIYCGKYPVNDIFDDLEVEKLNSHFLQNNYTVIPNTEKDPFTLDKTNFNLDKLVDLHRETVDNYIGVYDVADYMGHCLTDMNILSQNLSKIYEDICREEDYLKKNGLLFHHDKLVKQNEEMSESIRKKEIYLEDAFIKILDLKNLEKQAVELVKENKKLMATIYSNSVVIENKRKEIQNITTKRKFFLQIL